MRSSILTLIAIAAVLCACDKEVEITADAPVKKGESTLNFTATMEENNASKATLEGNVPSWEKGDRLSINGKAYSAQTDGTTTTFKADGEDATGTVYKAYFPESLYISSTIAALPAIQTYKAGKFDMPMYAESETTDLAFRNLCAVLAIKVTRADITTLKSIKITSDKKMNGTFTISENKAVMGTDGTEAVVLESPEALTLTAEGTTFHIAIPAQKYTYLNIFLSSDGKTYTQAMATKRANGLGEIERSKMFDIDYAKNATKLWEGNLFFADCNIGAKSVTEHGGYFTWGGMYANGNGIEWKDDHYNNIDDYYIDVISAEHDTATKLWGNNWRMPTSDELVTLVSSDKCNVKWIEGKNREYDWTTISGLLCTGKDDYEPNSVFLPAAGHCEPDEEDEPKGCIYGYGNFGNYWSSKPSGSYHADQLEFFSGNRSIYYTLDNSCYSVRAVLRE